MTVRIAPSGPIDARINAPGSKSLTNRALVVAGLAEGTSTLRHPLASDDTEVMVAALRNLGVLIADVGDREVEVWQVTGRGGTFAAPAVPLHCGLSGTTLRFLAAAATHADGPVTLTGHAPLLARPIGPLVAALQALGADVQAEGGLPPVHLGGGGFRGGRVSVDATASSQFVTAVLLAAPYAQRDVTVEIEGLGAPGYVDLTVDLMRGFGGQVVEVGTAWHVSSGSRYTAHEFDVEFDAAAASHLFALAVATGGRVVIPNAGVTDQPDAAVWDVFRSMGAVVDVADDGVTVTGPATIAPVTVDLESSPDQLATVAALAALADGTSTITGVAITRGHETDRVTAVATELRNLGVEVDESPDGLVIRGGTVGPGSVATYHDHRMAMGFAPLAAAVPGVVIEDPGCVAKTYPKFWDDLTAMGLAVTTS